MKRLMLLAVALIGLAGLALAQPAGGGYGRGPGMMGGGPGWGRGPGEGGGPGWSDEGSPGWSMGPGMMGGGMGMFDWDSYGQLPADKRAKLDTLSADTQRKMIGLMTGMHELMLVYRNSMTQFPIDKAAATKAWEGMNAMRKQMFEARLDAVAKAQEIVGKELWESQSEGWGPGSGPGRGPRGR